MSDESQTLATATGSVFARSKIPGAVVAVQENGRLVFDEGFGSASFSRGEAVTADTRFEIGSITKQFTAAAILQLRDRGQLSLDDKLGKYLPEYRIGRNVTLEQLLHQVSGIFNYTNVPGFFANDSKHGSFSAILGILAKRPLDFPTGTRWEYSNTNYVLLGRVVEIVSKTSWQNYAREHLFAPANMQNSGFIEDEREMSHMATGYIAKKPTFAPAAPLQDAWAFSAGDIVSTASDLAKWDEAYFAGKVISLDDVALVTSPGHLTNGESTGYGFGWGVDTFDGARRISHDGGTNGFSSENAFFPAFHQAVIVLTNTSGADPSELGTVAFEAAHPAIAAAQHMPAPGEDRRVTAIAERLWTRSASGMLDRSDLTAQFAQSVDANVLASMKAKYGPLGAPRSWIYRGRYRRSGTTVFRYRVFFSDATAYDVRLYVRNRKVSDLRIDAA